MTRFNGRRGLVVVNARLFGPSGDVIARLAVDTGASSTLVNEELLILIGYDPAALPKTVRFTTGSGVETAPRITIDRIETLGQVRARFSAIAHTLPSSAAIDGVLGLDFLRSHVVTIDFRNGEISLA